jgi:tripartite-type tricarboxylate transporter receptor subunit TctC
MPKIELPKPHQQRVARRRLLTTVARIALVASLGAVSQTFAQMSGYPNKPIRLIVPFAAGTSVDLVARIFAQRLSAEIGSAVIVEPRPGGGSILGTQYVAQAAPDGYTLLLGSNSALTIAPFMQSSLKYDPIKSFVPVVGLFTTSSVLLARAELPVQNLGDVIELARKSPGKISYGSYGIGTIPHLSMAILETRTNTTFNHIPYKGGSEAGQAAAAGDVDLGFETVPGATARIKTGRVKPIAIFQAKRSLHLPQIPSTVETGNGDANILGFVGVFAPAGTPSDVIAKLGGAAKAALQDPEFNKGLNGLGAEPLPLTASELAAVIVREMESVGTTIKRLSIKAE